MYLSTIVKLEKKFIGFEFPGNATYERALANESSQHAEN